MAKGFCLCIPRRAIFIYRNFSVYPCIPGVSAMLVWVLGKKATKGYFLFEGTHLCGLPRSETSHLPLSLIDSTLTCFISTPRTMMASFMSFFGGRRNTTQPARDAIVSMRQQLQMIEKKEDYLQKKIDEELKKAKANAVSNKAGTPSAIDIYTH